MKKIAGIILATIFLLASLPLYALAEDLGEGIPQNDIDSEDTLELDTHERRFYLPGNMRGVILRPNFENNNGKITDDTFNDIAALGMNSVIIATTDQSDQFGNNDLFCNTDMNKSDEPDFLSTAIETAKKRGFNIYLMFNVNDVLNKNDTNDINTLIAEIHKFTLKYYCDGIILDNYYSPRSEESFKSYMSFGAGIGYDNWLYDSTENFFKNAADTVRLTDNSIPIGIMLNDNHETAYSRGFSDTKQFIESGYVDFALVNTPEATDFGYEEITDYWGQVCETAKIPLYINHHNQKIGGESPGWGGDDQLLRQLSSAKKISVYSGSVFNSLHDLMENRLNSTDTMRMFFDDQINEETLFEDLVMHAPQSRSFATNDSIAIFQGTYDDNFEVSLNDVEITLNEAGNFYIEKSLAVGMNYFTLKHKGQVVTYSIERRVITLHDIDHSIANGKTLEVEGGTTITIAATAYRGASVTASINGQSVQLTQQDANLDDPTLNASYAPFVGRYKVPDGIVDQVQNLGVITVTATLNGNSRSMQGASVRVVALPPPLPPPPVNVELLDQDSAGSGEVVGRIDPVRSNSETVRYVRVRNNNTFVFAANTTGSERDPDISRLPAGTIDYHRSTVGGYYTTESGKRISADDAVLEDGNGMGENNLVVLSGGTSNKSSFFKIALDNRSSFNIKAAGMNYSVAWGGNYNINEFNASYIYIDFDNVTSVTKLPSFEHNHVFSSGRWETTTIEGIPKFRLVLELRQRGVYAGNYAYYNQNGELMLTFPVLTSSLSGMNIVIDPGHGVTESGFDPGAIGHIHEFDANIAVARKLRDRLRALGANATMLTTNESYYATKNRANYARDLYNCDLFISLHCNAVAGSTAKGTEVWYFTPFSQPLASEISSRISVYFQNSVYSDSVNRNRGSKYSYYLVTLAQDFPSVLVELGFVTNYEDAMALASDTHQTGIANAIADGIQRYLNRAS